MSKEAMTLALEALKTAEDFDIDADDGYYSKAIKALEEALAKQEGRSSWTLEDVKQAWKSGYDAAKQEQGEPVAYIHRNEYNEYRLEPHDNFDIKSIPVNVDVPLFKAPQPSQKPLTDEQIEAMWQEYCKQWKTGEKIVIQFVDFAKAIEAAHGIKENT